jgi:hypothetical protein
MPILNSQLHDSHLPKRNSIVPSTLQTTVPLAAGADTGCNPLLRPVLSMALLACCSWDWWKPRQVLFIVVHFLHRC